MKTKEIELVTGAKITLSADETKYFVSATDKFLSGWGLASGKIAKRVIICDNRQQAVTMCDRLQRPAACMSRINYTVSSFGPYYSPSKYVVSFDVYSDKLFNY